jgi:hypothetical protein
MQVEKCVPACIIVGNDSYEVLEAKGIKVKKSY